MDRRDFLKGTAGISLAGLGVLMWPALQLSALSHEASITVEAQVKGKMLRGTRDGLIFESLDGGKTWQRVANFDKHCSIAAIREQQNQIYADIVVQGYGFSLKSADVRVWRTVG